MGAKRAKCPQCGQPVRVPAADPATLPPTPAPARAADRPTVTAGGATAPRPGPAAEASGDTVAGRPAGSGAAAELTAFLAPAQAPDELGRLGPYRVLKVLGA